MQKPRNFLVYCGNPGLGKTYLCASLCEWCMKNFGNDWRYWKEYNLLEKLRSSMDSARGDYAHHLKYMIDSELLMIDDVCGTGKKTDWREEVLTTILDIRYESMKPTIITSNLCSEDFLKNYHPRIHSRLFSLENKIIEIPDGVDFRLEKMTQVENKFEKPIQNS